METKKNPQEGIGFVVTCQYCGHSRLVYREEIMRGDWQTCPYCFGEEEGREQQD
jgi:DNA-directed RNA polymerase subunit RPC12/RpoP